MSGKEWLRPFGQRFLSIRSSGRFAINGLNYPLKRQEDESKSPRTPHSQVPKKALLFKDHIEELFGVLVDDITTIESIPLEQLELIQLAKNAPKPLEEATGNISAFLYGMCKVDKDLVLILDPKKIAPFIGELISSSLSITFTKESLEAVH